MAVYKVPQDVEADDKLIGPFSFRQFIYLIVVAISIAGAWGLSQLFIPLAIIPLPVIVFFAALALPLRKDQPMEAYLTAVVSFYFLKSRKRFWIPDGINSFITIIPPKDADKIYTKDLNETEATKRLEYLSQLVDTHGWAIRGAGGTPDTSISTDLYFESRNSTQTPDMMDSGTAEAQELTKKLDDEADDRKQDAIDNMKAAAKEAPTPVATPVKAADKPADKSDEKPAEAATVVVKTETVPEPEPVSALPSIEQALAKQEASRKAAVEKEQLDAIALANALTEEVGEELAKPPAEIPVNTSVSTPDTGTMELTREQREELLDKDTSQDLKVSTVAGLAKHKAEENKALGDGDEVTISFR